MLRRGFFTSSPHGGDGVEADVGEEGEGGAGGDAGEFVGGEGGQVAGLVRGEGDGAEEGEDGELHDGHGGGGAGGFADAADQECRGEEDHDDGRDVDDAAVAGRGGECGGQLVAGEGAEEFVEVLAPADGHGGDGDAVLQQQAPAGEEGDAFAEGGVGEGVGGAGDGDGAAELGEGERGEDAGDRGEGEGDDDGGAGFGDAVGEADEDAGADDGADAEAHELEESHGAFEAVALAVRAGFGDELGRAFDAHGVVLFSGGAGVCSTVGSGLCEPGPQVSEEMLTEQSHMSPIDCMAIRVRPWWRRGRP